VRRGAPDYVSTGAQLARTALLRTWEGHAVRSLRDLETGRPRPGGVLSRLVLALLSSLALAACGSNGGTKACDDPVERQHSRLDPAGDGTRRSANRSYRHRPVYVHRDVRRARDLPVRRPGGNPADVVSRLAHVERNPADVAPCRCAQGAGRSVQPGGRRVARSGGAVRVTARAAGRLGRHRPTEP
jgi:hypothetical protein